MTHNIAKVSPVNDDDKVSEVLVASNPQEDIAVLTETLPQLEADCEDARRCFNIIAENFRIANSRLQAMLKTGKIDSAVHEFAYAVIELNSSLSPMLETVRQIEAATNELVKGAQGLPRS